MLTTCLALSNPLPIFLHLTITDEADIADFILQSVVRHCARWAEVHLNIDASHFDKLSPIKGNLPLLHSLEVQTLDDFEMLRTWTSLRAWTALVLLLGFAQLLSEKLILPRTSVHYPGARYLTLNFISLLISTALMTSSD
ncbi:hypothetical protein K435DRAFT_448515 [Dendrothele bispora CBS 962.96]|uniref:Uncharacterized protein n=1 Tax=Dendrothele bispora (strain CBS 962.96) TaxID=1314807 RepID=A0A4V4HCA0_DENBC|nr:hypothetical protein K435DRAFT_448515 [Dendrothele bispora CBS 962.96]